MIGFAGLLNGCKITLVANHQDVLRILSRRGDSFVDALAAIRDLADRAPPAYLLDQEPSQLFDNPNQISNGFSTGNPIRAPYPGEAGQRNGFRGDGYFDIDSSLSKTWSLAERAKLKFAWEVYNVSNSTRFDVSPAGLNAGLGSGAIAIGYYDASLTTYRRMQFGLRLDF